MRFAIPFTQPHLPRRSRYDRRLDGVWRRNRLTNSGPLLAELTERLAERLDVPRLLLVANGTIALQVACRVLGVRIRAVTTPFTFAATSGAIVWAGAEPVYWDVDPKTFNLETTRPPDFRMPSAFVPVHIFGNPCDTDAIEQASGNFRAPVIYDAAHAFDVRLRGRGILSYGDASTISFHATKVFHTIEGGAIAFRRQDDHDRAAALINFGFDGSGNVPDELGINAKMSEVHAAMGLSVLEEINDVIDQRRTLVEAYSSRLSDDVVFQAWNPDSPTLPFAFMPVLFGSRADRDRAKQDLELHGIEARAHFPSLDASKATPIATDLSERILCLPLYAGLAIPAVDRICQLVRRAIKAVA